MIALAGFMGCGKSSLGKHLAQKMGRRFVDLDQVIERDTKMQIAEIFARFGELAFREIELTALKRVDAGALLALGGGTLTHPSARVWLFRNAVTVFLDVPLFVIEQRLARSHERPLSQSWRLRNLYRQRRPVYRACDVVVRAPHVCMPVEPLANYLIRRLGTTLRKQFVW
ncbi:MAG: shikimate kinase [Acidobacteria bacterium]|nr:shikimate kinase [Acidobacteriota bacterium]